MHNYVCMYVHHSTCPFTTAHSTLILEVLTALEMVKTVVSLLIHLKHRVIQSCSICEDK